MSRSAFKAVAVVLALGAGTAFAQETSTKSGKLHVSSNSEHTIQFFDHGNGRCEIEVTRNKLSHYKVEQCLGGVDDLFFVSDSGERFWVVKTLPETPEAPKKSAGRAMVRGTPWTSTVVAQLFDRTGKQVQQRILTDMVTPREREEVQRLGRRFKWIEGVQGMRGRPPRVNDQNQVELETVGSRTVRLAFPE
jgi:hypothetical protein